MPGQKIDWLRANPQVCIQVGEIKNNEVWWSVVVEGRYEEFPDDE
jgi:nitroimidazol reductase NimA-like FMN-containing flavoprotein (pyridoxamine 5'-phosphate oxidase superfamily)